MSLYNLKRGVAVLDDIKDSALIGGAAGAKTVFYVEGNAGNDNNSGESWDEAFKTLTVALAASHADISSGSTGWASRNVIYCKGDALDEDLVLLAQKTDVVGVGNYNQWPKCGLIGNHVPTGTTAAYGTRFFNFFFQGNAAGGDLWTLDSTVSGLGFFGCTFSAGSTTAATAAIVSTASPFLELVGNEIHGKFSDAAIEFGAGDARGTRILGNHIEGALSGIEFGAGVTSSTGSAESILVKDNYVKAATECINDAASIVSIVNNVCVTLQAKGSGGAGAIVADEFLCGGNKISASDLANADYPALGTL